MKKIIKYLTVFIFIATLFVILWFVLNNIGSTKSKLLLCILAGLGIFVKLFSPKPLVRIKQRIANIAKNHNFSIAFFMTVLILGIILRFSFYFIYKYIPYSDPGSFFNQAQAIANGTGLNGNTFVAFFPYLAAYSNLLGGAIKIFGNPWLATIILNTIFDILGAVIAMLLVKSISIKDSKRPLIAFALWTLSPFNIIFSVLSLPIIVVNFFIILTVYLARILSQNIIKTKTKQSIIFSLIFGIVVGCGNCFRPIFSVALIAMAIYFIYIASTSKISFKKIALMISSLALIITIFLCVQNLYVSLVSYQTEIQAPSNAGGWSVYVGSNSAATGSWNIEDDKYLYNILKTNSNLEQVHKRLTGEGITRYKSYGISGTLNLMIRKLALFSGSQASVYDTEASVIGYKGSIIAKLFSVYILTYIFLIFAAGAQYLFLLSKKTAGSHRLQPIILFISLLVLGFFFSAMLVESQLRYAQIMYPLFIILAAMRFNTNIDNAIIFNEYEKN